MLTVHSSASLKKTLYSVQNPKCNSLLGTKRKFEKQIGTQSAVLLIRRRQNRHPRQSRPRCYWNQNRPRVYGVGFLVDMGRNDNGGVIKPHRNLMQVKMLHNFCTLRK